MMEFACLIENNRHGSGRILGWQRKLLQYKTTMITQVLLISLHCNAEQGTLDSVININIYVYLFLEFFPGATVLLQT